LGYLDFAEGKVIGQKIAPITFIANETIDFTDYLPNDFGLPLFSINLCHALDAFGIRTVQYFPVQILDSSHRLIRNDYFVANITESTPCFDAENSEYDIDAYRKLGMARRIQKLVIDSSIIGERHLFRIAESWTVMVVSEALREFLCEYGVRGVDFMPVEAVCELATHPLKK